MGSERERRSGMKFDRTHIDKMAGLFSLCLDNSDVRNIVFPLFLRPTLSTTFFRESRNGMGTASLCTETYNLELGLSHHNLMPFR